MSGEKLENGVRIEHVDGHWAVQILEDGEIIQRLFATEEFANNYAIGQRIRLFPQTAAPRKL